MQYRAASGFGTKTGAAAHIAFVLIFMEANSHSLPMYLLMKHLCSAVKRLGFPTIRTALSFRVSFMGSYLAG